MVDHMQSSTNWSFEPDYSEYFCKVNVGVLILDEATSLLLQNNNKLITTTTYHSSGE